MYVHNCVRALSSNMARTETRELEWHHDLILQHLFATFVLTAASGRTLGSLSSEKARSMDRNLESKVHGSAEARAWEHHHAGSHSYMRAHTNRKLVRRIFRATVRDSHLKLTYCANGQRISRIIFSTSGRWIPTVENVRLPRCLEGQGNFLYRFSRARTGLLSRARAHVSRRKLPEKQYF